MSTEVFAEDLAQVLHDVTNEKGLLPPMPLSIAHCGLGYIELQLVEPCGTAVHAAEAIVMLEAMHGLGDPEAKLHAYLLERARAVEACVQARAMRLASP